jgi:hypothetical protein
MSTDISTQRAGGLALQSFDDAFRFSKMVAASEFAPKDFRGKPESCLLAIQHGSELGLSPMQSLQSIAVVNGRPAVYGDAALALVQSSPACLYVREYVEGEGDNLTAVCEVQRRGYPQPTVAKFSVADAKKASLWGKTGPWSQYPSRMLGLRARGFALRNAFADALRGLVTAEEAQDYPTPEPVREPVVVRSKPHTPEVRTTPADVAPLVTTSPQDDPVGKAKLSISAAKTIDRLDTIRRTIDERVNEGVLTSDQAGELVQLTIYRAEMLAGEEVAT